MIGDPDTCRAVLPDGRSTVFSGDILPCDFPVGTRFYFGDEDLPRFTVLSRENGVTRIMCHHYEGSPIEEVRKMIQFRGLIETFGDERK